MANEPKPKIIVIVGPTASGKSNLAVSLARKFHGEIVSADSRQVYRGLDIGTGKITRHEMRSIPIICLMLPPQSEHTPPHISRVMEGVRLGASSRAGISQSSLAEPAFISARLWTIFQFLKYRRMRNSGHSLKRKVRKNYIAYFFALTARVQKRLSTRTPAVSSVRLRLRRHSAKYHRLGVERAPTMRFGLA